MDDGLGTRRCPTAADGVWCARSRVSPLSFAAGGLGLLADFTGWRGHGIGLPTGRIAALAVGGGGYRANAALEWP